MSRSPNLCDLANGADLGNESDRRIFKRMIVLGDSSVGPRASGRLFPPSE